MFNINNASNSLAFWGAMLNHVGTVGQSWWEALYSKNVLEKKKNDGQAWKLKMRNKSSIGGWPAPRSSNLGPFANNVG